MSIVEQTLNKLRVAQEAADERSRKETPRLRAAEADLSRAVREPPPVSATVEVDHERLLEYKVPLSQEQGWRTVEEFRRLKWPVIRTARGQGQEQGRGPLVLVTSAAPGDGKTFVAISLALSIAAERDCGVLLVDGDCARRRATELFNAGARPGLTELLEDGKRSLNEVVVGTNIPGVRLLPAGQPDPNAAELLASRRMDEITRELTTTYSDYIVLFDSPPLLATNEAQVLARRMGQILFVVRSGETPHALVTEALELFAEDAHVSCVVNFASPNDASRYSGYEHYRKSSKRTA